MMDQIETIHKIMTSNIYIRAFKEDYLDHDCMYPDLIRKTKL